MTRDLTQKAPNVPTEERALARLRRNVELGQLEEVPGVLLPGEPLYLVTYMNSQTGGRIRSATIVTVTNQSTQTNLVTVTWFKGLTDNSSPVGASSFLIPPDFTVDFGSRDLPFELTAVNSIPATPLVFDEGRAIVSARLREIGVSARVYYTSGDADEELLSITDSKVVVFGQGNSGD